MFQQHGNRIFHNTSNHMERRGAQRADDSFCFEQCLGPYGRHKNKNISIKFVWYSAQCFSVSVFQWCLYCVPILFIHLHHNKVRLVFMMPPRTFAQQKLTYDASGKWMGWWWLKMGSRYAMMLCVTVELFGAQFLLSFFFYFPFGFCVKATNSSTTNVYGQQQWWRCFCVVYGLRRMNSIFGKAL